MPDRSLPVLPHLLTNTPVLSMRALSTRITGLAVGLIPTRVPLSILDRTTGAAVGLEFVGQSMTGNPMRDVMPSLCNARWKLLTNCCLPKLCSE